MLPYSKVIRMAKKKFINPLIGLTNIGVIDNEKLVFGNLPIVDAFITGSIKYPPYFQLTFTSFNESITFSINNFFNILNNELPNHIGLVRVG